MTFFDRAKTTGRKAFRMVFGRFQQRWAMRRLGGTRLDYASEVEPSTNAIVMAAVNWIARTFPEAPPRVLKRSGTEMAAIPDHPLTQLLRRPNPFYSGVLLWTATIASWILTGNAYWIKERSQAGRVVRLWWIPSNLITPAWPDDGTEFVSHYEYKPDGRSIPLRVETTDIVHIRYGLDPDNPRLGLSPLASLFREIFTDDQAANFTAALLRNLGVPGVVIVPDDGGLEIGQQEADQIKDEFSARFSSDRRGEPLVLSSRAKVQVLSFSPEQMDLRNNRRVPEERITAVIGIPAIVAGLGAGLDRSTFANYAEAREAAYESNIIPAQRLFAEELRVQLLGDFADITRTEIDFDLSQVRVLQDDQNKLVERLTRALLAGGLLLSEYRRQLPNNVPELPDTDVLYVPTNITPMPVGDLTAPAPPPAAANGQQPPNGTEPPAQNGKALLDLPVYVPVDLPAKRRMRIEYEDGHPVGLAEE